MGRRWKGVCETAYRKLGRNTQRLYPLRLKTIVLYWSRDEYTVDVPFNFRNGVFIPNCCEAGDRQDGRSDDER